MGQGREGKQMSQGEHLIFLPEKVYTLDSIFSCKKYSSLPQTYISKTWDKQQFAAICSAKFCIQKRKVALL